MKEKEMEGRNDLARAAQFEGSLGSDDSIKGISGQGEVDLGVALGQGRKEGGFGNEEGGVAASDKAVVEEEAESAGGGGRVGNLLGGDDVGDDLLDGGAGAAVIVRTEEGV